MGVRWGGTTCYQSVATADTLHNTSDQQLLFCVKRVVRQIVRLLSEAPRLLSSTKLAALKNPEEFDLSVRRWFNFHQHTPDTTHGGSLGTRLNREMSPNHIRE